MNVRKASNNVLYIFFVFMTGVWVVYSTFISMDAVSYLADGFDEIPVSIAGYGLCIILILAFTIRQICKRFISFSKVKIILCIIGTLLYYGVACNSLSLDLFDEFVYGGGANVVMPCAGLLIIWLVIYVINNKNDNDLLFDDHCEVLTAIMFGTVSAIPVFVYLLSEL